MFARMLGLLAVTLVGSVAVAQLPLGTPTNPALEGEWVAVEGKHAGKALTKEQLGKIKFSSGDGGVGIDLTPVVPAAAPVKSFFVNVTPAAKQLRFGRNIGLKAVSYYGIYEAKDDTLKIGLALLPWERSTADPSFWMNRPKGFPTEKEPNGGPDTILVFKRVKK
jgi:hypothetical protein